MEKLPENTQTYNDSMNNLNLTHNDVGGWFNFQDIYESAVNSFDNATFVEVGTFLGKSAMYMMEKIKESQKNIKFYCVDLFTITPDHGDGEMPDGQNARIWQNENGGKDALYNSFLHNINNSIAKDCLAGHYRCDSADGAKYFEDQSVDFCFIDASHLYENVYKDLNAWLPKIKSGGILAGHDFDFHGNNGVGKAVNQFCQENNFTYNNNYSFWIKI
jgi:hypothetical protein